MNETLRCVREDSRGQQLATRVEVSGDATMSMRGGPDRPTARVSVEQASIFGWAKYVGMNGHCIGMRSYGASAPLKELQREFGFSAENVAAAAKEQLKRAGAK